MNLKFGVDWINLAENRGLVVGSCVHGNEPSVTVKGEEAV